MVRVRSAPSPTGALHVGTARTILFNWLFARAKGGVHLLRIEDTDRERSTDDSVQGILDGIHWLGLEYDGEPVFQSRRLDRHREAVATALAAGTGYRCRCSAEELEKMRETARVESRKPGYDGRCRDAGVSADEPHCVRLRIPDDGETTFHDLIRGPITFANDQLDDFVIARSDGTPTYNFVVVVDDVDMAITHVLRGDDHVANTPKQIWVYRALGAEPPAFAHLPMINGPDGRKLSKRHGATAVQDYRDQGFLPEALRNYLVRLGWGHGDQEVFTTEELFASFDLGGIGKSASIFDLDKLRWMNMRYIQTLPDAELRRSLDPVLRARGHDPAAAPWISDAIACTRERSKTLLEMADGMEPFFATAIDAYDEKAIAKFGTPENAALLGAYRARLATVEPFRRDALEEATRAFIETTGTKLGTIAQTVRIALTGGTVSPPIFDVLQILGRERVLDRVDRLIERLKA